MTRSRTRVWMGNTKFGGATSTIDRDRRRVAVFGMEDLEEPL